MSRSLAVASATSRLAMTRTVRQPSAFAFTALTYVLVTTALSTVWRVAADANGGEVVGYSAAALVWYVAAAEASVIPIPQRLIETTGEDIRSGRIHVEMLRPVASVVSRLSFEIGAALPRTAAVMALGLVFSLIVAGAPESATALALAGPAILIAVAVNISAQHVFASATFWLRNATSAWFLYQKFVFLVGGMLLPLEVLPDAVADVVRYLPFAAMAYVPARLASGHLEPELLLVQLGWLVALAAAATGSFALGERRLRTVGG